MPDFEPALIVLIVVFCIALLAYTSGWRNTLKARDAARKSKATTDQILRETIGEIPDVELKPAALDSTPHRDVKSFAALYLIFAVSFLILYVGLGVAIHAILPMLNNSGRHLIDVGLSLFLPSVLSWIIFPLITRWLLLSSPEHMLTKGQMQFLAMLSYGKLIGLAVNFVTLPFVVVPAYGWVVAFNVYVVNYLVLLILWASFKKSAIYFPSYWAHHALLNGDYDEALRRIDYIEKKYGVAVSTTAYRATILLFAGKYREAEAMYRQILPELKTRNQSLPGYLGNLGYALLRQERYAEAVPMLQAAINLDPRAGHAHSSLAEVYLYQGIEPQKALDMMTEYMMRTPRNRVKDKTVWGAVLGDKAWALAMLGRHTAAVATLKQAFEHTDKSSKYSRASLYFREGKIYTIQGKTRSAGKSYERAIDLDPAGAYGQSSRQALAALHGSDKAT